MLDTLDSWPATVATAVVVFLYLFALYLGALFYALTERWTR